MTPAPDEVQLQIVGVFEHHLEVGNEEQHAPLLLLKDSADRELRLPVDSCEGFAIHIALDEPIVHRPLPHDIINPGDHVGFLGQHGQGPVQGDGVAGLEHDAADFNGGVNFPGNELDQSAEAYLTQH